MKDVKTMILEDGEYMVIDECLINNTNYIHFAKVDDPEDFCIRKVNIIDGEEIIVGLDNMDEFNLALKSFADKHINTSEN